MNTPVADTLYQAAVTGHITFYTHFLSYCLYQLFCLHFLTLKLFRSTNLYGDRGSTVVNVLCYKSEGRWFDSRWYHWYFSLT